MDIGRAITYIFEDRKWVSKLLPLVVIGLLSMIPVFGLLALAVAMGFMLQLARGVRDGLPRPLPQWNDWQQKFRIGAPVVMATIAYNLPIILMSICSWGLVGGLTEGFLGPTLNVFLICCTVPILLLYTLLAYPMLAIGVTEYIETGEWERMFRVGHLWDVIRANSNVVFTWVLYAILLNVAIGIVGAIPCLGWLVILLFGIPIHGHLFGQFAHRLGVVNKPRAKKRQA